MLKAQPLCTSAQSNLWDGILGKIRKNSFIPLPGNGEHSRLVPWKVVHSNPGGCDEKFYSRGADKNQDEYRVCLPLIWPQGVSLCSLKNASSNSSIFLFFVFPFWKFLLRYSQGRHSFSATSPLVRSPSKVLFVSTMVFFIFSISSHSVLEFPSLCFRYQCVLCAVSLIHIKHSFLIFLVW